MADNQRIVYPDEVEDAKAAAAEKKNVNAGGDSNSIEDAPPEPAASEQLSSRNLIVAPPNCPPGFQMGKDGVCREVSDF